MRSHLTKSLFALFVSRAWNESRRFLRRTRRVLKTGPTIMVILAQLLSLSAPLVALAAPTASNAVGSNATIDPVANKVTRLQTQGATDVDQSTGAFLYSYPLSLPKGRNGVTPKLNVSYNSQNTHSGMLGYAWNIDIPYIERMNKSGSEKMYSMPAYASSLHGELTTTNGVNFEQKIDDGSYAKYVQRDGVWEMTDRDGNIYTYGQTANERVQNESGARVGRWYLSSLRDKFGNGVSYQYTRVSGSLYPAVIEYTEHPSAPASYRIDFVLEDRQDKLVNYGYGFRIEDTKRIAQIRVSAGNVVSAYFNFGYSAGSNGVRSLLATIEEKRLGSNGDWTVIPKTKFEYKNSAISFDGSVSPSVNPYGSNVVLDSNNDGILDLYSVTEAYFPVDVNGDFKKDLALSDFDYRATSDGQKYSIKFKYNRGSYIEDSVLANGVRWYSSGVPAGLAIPPLRATGQGSTDPMLQSGVIGDLNGDGFDDVIYSSPLAGFGVGINTASSSFDYSKPAGYSFSLEDGLADLNNDGLADRIAITKSATSTVYRVYLNTGNGFDTTVWATYDAGIVGQSFDNGVRFLDINNDGLPDIIRSYSSFYCNASSQAQAPWAQNVNQVLINTGSGFATTSVALPGYLVKYTGCPAATPTFASVKEYDRDGDLDVDFDGITNLTAKQDVLARVVTSLGGTVDVAYDWSTKGGLNPSLPIPMYVVSSTTERASPADSNPHIVNYAFTGGKMYFDPFNPRDRRFAGFGRVDVTDGSLKVSSYFHQGDGDATTSGEQGDAYYNIGRVFRKDYFNIAGASPVLLRNVYSQYKVYTYASSVFSYLNAEVTNTYNQDGTWSSSGMSNEYDLPTRLISSASDFADIAPFISFASSTISDQGIDVLQTKYEYTNGRPQRIFRKTVSDYSGNTVARTTTYFDNLPLAGVTRGAPTRVVNEVFDNKGAVTATTSESMTYDSAGNVVSRIDNLGRERRWEFDSSLLFPQKYIDPSGGITSYVYDPVTQQVLTEIGPDGISKVSQYDGFGNSTRRYVRAASGAVTNDEQTSYVFGSGISVFRSRILDSSHITRSVSHYDGLGRLDQEKTEDTTGSFITINTRYDARSNVAGKTIPFMTSGNGYTTSQSTNGEMTYQYDVLGRVTLRKIGAQEVYYTYNGRTVFAEDNATVHKKKSFTFDARNNLLNVGEFDDGKIYSTKYVYTPLGKLASIIDAQGNVRVFGYDSDGAVVYQEDPHAIGDQTYVAYRYQYDTARRLAKKVGPLGTFSYSYDLLDRPLGQSATGTAATGTNVSVDYGTCVNTYLSPCSVTRDGSTTVYMYDAFGRISSETLSIDGNTFTRSYEYDGQGNPTIITYPDGGKLKYTYGLSGKQVALTYVTPDGAEKKIVNNAQQNSLGLPVRTDFGNGLTSCNQYSGLFNGNAVYPRLTNSTYALHKNSCDSVGSEEVNLYGETFSYSDQSTLSGVTISYRDIAGGVHAKSDTFTYDNLMRIAAVGSVFDATTLPQHTFAYDPLGNILQENSLAYLYNKDGPQSVHAPTAIGGTHIEYDAQGNRLHFGDTTYSWDAMNRLNSLSNSSEAEQYSYDEKGERIKRTVTPLVLRPKTVANGSGSVLQSSLADSGLLGGVVMASTTTYIAVQSYDWLSSVPALLSTSSLRDIVRGYYGSPFIAKYCLGDMSCAASTTKQLVASELLRQTGTSSISVGVIDDVISVARGERNIPSSRASYVSGPSASLINYLIVGGGGSGGGSSSSFASAGGGGAGAVLSGTDTISGGSYPVIIGAGGAQADGEVQGNNGGDSSFNLHTAIGGGGGGRSQSAPGNNGGSGGGGGSNPGQPGGIGASGGNNGGSGLSSISSGGGGGASSVGGSGNSSASGYGGSGIQSSISGTSTYYGGGGGGGRSGGYSGAGGVGGGGTGALASGGPASGAAGVDGLGGGGGGGSRGGSGGKGGRGIVIISYPTASGSAAGGTITYGGGNTIHTFTSNGNFDAGLSVADFDSTNFDVTQSILSDYVLYVSTGIVVAPSFYATLPLVSTSTFQVLVTAGLTNIPKIRTLFAYSGCGVASSSQCIDAEKVVFEQIYKSRGVLLSDKVLYELWKVFKGEARVPGNLGEYATAETILLPSSYDIVSGLSSSSFGVTYNPSTYFGALYTARTIIEPRLYYFDRLPYLITRQSFNELSALGIDSRVLGHYTTLIRELLGIQPSDQNQFMYALGKMIALDKKATISGQAFRELYLVVIGAGEIPLNDVKYDEKASFDISDKLQMTSFYNESQGKGFFYLSYVYSTTGCFGGYLNGQLNGGRFSRCALKTQPFVLPVLPGTMVNYVFSLKPSPVTDNGTPTVWETTNPNTYFGTYSYTRTYPATVDPVEGRWIYDVTPTISKTASSTVPEMLMIANQTEVQNNSTTWRWFEAKDLRLIANTEYVRSTLGDLVPAFLSGTSTSPLASMFIPMATSSIPTSLPQTYSLSTNLNAYYKLDDLTSGGVDATGNGNTLANSGGVSNVSGKLNNAAFYNGSNTQRLAISSNLGFTATSTNTWSIWIKPTVNTGYYLDTFTTVGAQKRILLYGDPSNSRVVLYVNGTDNVLNTGNGSIATGNWYHIVVTHNNGNVELFLNGVSKGTSMTSGVAPDAFNALSLGQSYNTIWGPTNTAVDEVGVWSKVLTPTEIKALYNSGSSYSYPYPGPIASNDGAMAQLESLLGTTTVQSINGGLSSYYTEVADTTQVVGSSATQSGITVPYISQESLKEFASTTLVSAYDIGQIFSIATSTNCEASASTSECDKQARMSTFRSIVGNLSGFIPSQAATEEFWMVYKGALKLPAPGLISKASTSQEIPLTASRTYSYNSGSTYINLSDGNSVRYDETYYTGYATSTCNPYYDFGSTGSYVTYGRWIGKRCYTPLSISASELTADLNAVSIFVPVSVVNVYGGPLTMNFAFIGKSAYFPINNQVKGDVIFPAQKVAVSGGYQVDITDIAKRVRSGEIEGLTLVTYLSYDYPNYSYGFTANSSWNGTMRIDYARGGQQVSRNVLLPGLATSTATSTVDLQSVPTGLLSNIQFRNAYGASSTPAIKTVSEETINELAHTPLRFKSDIGLVFNYALSFASSSCVEGGYTDVCMKSAKLAKVREYIGNASGFLLSDAALEEIYRVNQETLLLIPLALEGATYAEESQNIEATIDASKAFVSVDTASSTTIGKCYAGSMSGMINTCQIFIPEIDSSVDTVSLALTSAATGTLGDSADIKILKPTQLSEFGLPIATTSTTTIPTYETFTVSGSLSGDTTTVDITNVYKTYIARYPADIVVSPKLNPGSTSTEVISAKLAISRKVLVPKIAYSVLQKSQSIDRSELGVLSNATSTSIIRLGQDPVLDFSARYLSPLAPVSGNTGMPAVSYITAPLVNGLYANYHFDESSGNASDATGLSSALTLNSNYQSYSSGKFGNAAIVGNYFGVNSALGYDPNGANTWSVWVNDQTAQNLIFNASNFLSYGNGYAVYLAFDKTSRSLYASINNATIYADGVTPGAWHNVVLTHTGNTYDLYVDGVHRGGTVATGAYWAYTCFAVGQYCPGTYFRESSSYVDEVALWNRALSGTEVQQMYNNGNGFIYPFRTVAPVTLSTTNTSATVTYDPITVVATSTLYTTPYPFIMNASTTAVHTLTDATTTAYTVYSPFEGYEYDSRGSNTTSFTLNGTLVGAYTYDRSDPTSGKVTYTITNYLGTPVLSTDENGDIVESFLTDVFGNLYYRDARQDNAFHSKGYTSHTFDSESGLTYAHARYLDTSVHSFLSVDPIQYNLTKEALYDPQSLNGYAYGRNNPVLFKDPDGRAYMEASGSITYGFVTGSAGLRMNADGVDLFLSGGAALGAEAGLEFSISPAGELLQQSDSQFSVSTSVRAAAGAGLKVGARSDINPEAFLRMGNNIKSDSSVIVGEGASISREYEIAIPLLRNKHRKLEPSYMQPKLMFQYARSSTVLNDSFGNQNATFLKNVMHKFVNILSQMVTLRAQQAVEAKVVKNKKS